MTLDETIANACVLLQRAVDSENWILVEEVIQILYELLNFGGTSGDVWD